MTFRLRNTAPERCALRSNAYELFIQKQQQCAKIKARRKCETRFAASYTMCTLAQTHTHTKILNFFTLKHAAACLPTLPTRWWRIFVVAVFCCCCLFFFLQLASTT